MENRPPRSGYEPPEAVREELLRVQRERRRRERRRLLLLSAGALALFVFAAWLSVSRLGPGDGAEPMYPMDPIGRHIVTVLFATDRQTDASASLHFGGERSTTISYGSAEVSIPPNHKKGRLERPLRIWRFEMPESSFRHVVVKDSALLPKLDFFNQLRNLAEADNLPAFVYVHGYNTPFRDAILRAGQLAYDLQPFVGVPIAYSWASRGVETGYVADKEAARATRPRLREFLNDVAAVTSSRNVYLVAHSMGTYALAEALSDPQLKPHFTEIVLAAPDIDSEIFKTQLAPAIVNRGPTTLYASANDQILNLSRLIQAGPRAGHILDGVVVVPGVETIDASNVSTLLGHSDFGDVRSVVEDISLLLRGNRPDRRNLLPKTMDNGLYWLFAK